MSAIRKLITTFLALIICAPCLGRWYQVEVIAFEHTDTGIETQEAWRELDELPKFSRAIAPIVALPEMDDEPEFDEPGPVAFALLAREERKLNGVFDRLQRLGGYRPLFHAAWRQPRLTGRRARDLHLSDLNTRLTVPDQLVAEATTVEGLVKLNIARLLHVDVDFVFFGNAPPVRLTARRKVKMRELHYFDHPLFGVFVQVTPYVLPSREIDEEQPEEAENGS
ncbi:MAG: CsiV family protein [Pseudomonadota bacterium]